MHKTTVYGCSYSASLFIFRKKTCKNREGKSVSIVFQSYKIDMIIKVLIFSIYHFFYKMGMQ